MAYLLLVAACGRQPADIERRWPVMGTYASVRVYTAEPAAGETAFDTVRAAFDEVDASMSNWKEASELSRVNREAALGGTEVRDKDLLACLEAAFALAETTEGAFDPTIGPLMKLYGFRPRAPRVPSPSEIEETIRHVGFRKVVLDGMRRSVRFLDPGVEVDLGGIAKGCALDVAARRLDEAASPAGLLDLGEQVLVRGRPPGGGAWRIGIRDPEGVSTVIAVLEIESGSIATSSDYENAFATGGRTIGHIMDPRTGRPAASGVLAATAVAPQATIADALSTALFVAGPSRAAEILGRFPQVEAVLLVEGEGGIEVLASGSLEARLRLEPAFRTRLGHDVRFDLPPRAR